MTQPIAGTYSTLVTLGSGSYNPTTIAATGLLSDGLLVSYQGLTVVNAGSIAGPDVSGGFGIDLTTGGSVTNQSGGAISGYDGIYSRRTATVVNAGSIAGSTKGVYLLAGGSVTNQSGGAITGRDGIDGENFAVTVTNAGSITGSFGGVLLFAAGGSVTNQSGGVISGNDGIVDTAGAVTVVNAGSIAANAGGVVLLAGGSVTNKSGGAISGAFGIEGRGAGVTVVNAGSIAGSGFGIYLYAGGSVTNQSGGAISATTFGIYLYAGGSVTNQNGGVISGRDGIFAAGASTVVNAGSIGGNATSGLGVYLRTGGSLTNQAGGTISGGVDAVKFRAGDTGRLVIDPGAVFVGTVDGGNTIGAATLSTLELASASSAGTLSGLGTEYVDFAQVTVDAGAQWTLQTTDTIEAGVTLTNAGTLSGPVTLVAGGVLSNASTGTVTAPGGAAVFGAADGAATVVNAGVIADSGGFPSFGIELRGGGSVTNQSGGTISGYWGINAYNAALTVVNAGSITGSDAGVYLVVGGGSVTNQSGGTISGRWGISAYHAALTVVNAGGITGNGGLGVNLGGVYLGAGGSVTNQSGGTISGEEGIKARYAALTVVNAGTIAGGTGRYAVDFGAGYANRLVIDPNAVFSGQVTGGNGIGAAYVSTLELASAGSAGTLSGLGTEYVDFTQITVDAGAQWTLTGANTIAAGYTLIDAGTLTNAGSLSGALTLAAGGILSNAATGTVTASGGAAVYGTKGGAATVVNAGGIAGSNALDGFGIDLAGGGSVTNQSGGTITGYAGIFAVYDAITVVNAGSIAGDVGAGIDLAAGGNVTNQSGGAISGFDGIYGRGTATVVNAGTITGSSYAVQFAPGVANRLIADPGAVFTGAVYGGGGVVELASAASAGTLSGFGAAINDITNFSTLQFDAGAAWTVSGNGSASGLGTIAITGFGDGDTIDLTGFVAVSETFASNTLVLTDGGGAHETLAIQGDFTTGSFTLTQDGPDGTDVVVCFAAGTQIGTPDGEVPVEQLQIGDRVLTAHNGPRPVTWIGQGKVLAPRGRRSAATPVIVRKGALADNVPNRDLHVTKAHSLYIDDVLIPVEFLVNHRTILWDDRAQEVEIYHVELDSHDVLWANGALAESYRDDGNRWLFQNANADWHLPPQEPYAPVLTGGPVVDAAWRRLLDRAGPRALPPLTEDPDLHLVIDGVRVDPEYRHGSLHGFRLPCSPKSVVIASRAGVPSELGIARDPRPLGVALRQVAIRQGGKFMLLEADDDRLTVGFHAYEADCCLRWTDGSAMLPIAAFARFDKGAEVMLHLGGATQFPDDQASPASAAA